MAGEEPETTEFDLSQSPGHLLHRAQQFASERFMKAMEGEKLTQRQFAVLHATGSREGLTQTELVKATGIDRSTLAELVSRMQRNGFLAKEKLPDDARANAIHLTAHGRTVLDKITQGAQDADSDILSAIPKNKRTSFLKTLRRIAEVLEEGEAAERLAREKEKEKKKKKKAKAKEKAKAKLKAKEKTRRKKKERQAA
ncbi:MarR family winged helix-turn-helix transcriptional regulator [Maricaulis sp. D1M11]|uniref:MarR family winged helix-turn-helix transcriptional regulator n=1 Tax=Maricaulis sp. D1M11 TaxID=3076117 RepID=UPI0039B65F93